MIPSLPVEITRRIIFFCKPLHSYHTTKELLEVFARLAQVNSVWREVAKETSDQYFKIRLVPRDSDEEELEPMRLMNLKKVRFAYVINSMDSRGMWDRCAPPEAKHLELLGRCINVEELWIRNSDFPAIVSCLSVEAKKSEPQSVTVDPTSTDQVWNDAELQELQIMGETFAYFPTEWTTVQLDALRHLTIHHVKNPGVGCPNLTQFYFPSLFSLTLTVLDLDGNSGRDWPSYYFEDVARQITTLCLSQVPHSQRNYDFNHAAALLPIFTNLKHFAHFVEGAPQCSEKQYPWDVLFLLNNKVKLLTYTTNIQAVPIRGYASGSTAAQRVTLPPCLTGKDLEIRVACFQVEKTGDLDDWSLSRGESEGDLKGMTHQFFHGLVTKWGFVTEEGHHGDYLDLWEQMRKKLE